jgi:hypothetical protein
MEMQPVMATTVFVVEGAVSFGYFNGTAGTPALRFSTPGTWQTLRETVPDVPVASESEVLVYSQGTNPYTDAYISSVSLEAMT